MGSAFTKVLCACELKCVPGKTVKKTQCPTIQASAILSMKRT